MMVKGLSDPWPVKRLWIFFALPAASVKKKAKETSPCRLFKAGYCQKWSC